MRTPRPQARHAPARFARQRGLQLARLINPVEPRPVDAEGQGQGGRERTLPLPAEVKGTIDEYLRLDAGRRRNLHSGGAEAFLFQPYTNYRTLEFARPISARMAHLIVAKWGDYCGLGRLSPRDLRRTAIKRALDQGLSCRQVQMMSGHRDPKIVMRYDHGGENLEQNAVNFLSYASDPGQNPEDDKNSDDHGRERQS